MNYQQFSKLEGKHAFLAPSKAGWENKDLGELFEAYGRIWVPEIGTALHDICRKHIKRHEKLTDGGKKEVRLSLLEDYHIPEFALNNNVDFDGIYETCKLYVKDAIGFRLVPEQILCYSEDFCFGTADAISELDSVFKTRFLRIHDLKTGKIQAHMEQLEKYAAIFCLQYNVKPADIDIELRLYQLGEVIVHNPTVEDIVPIMDTIVTDVKALTKLKAEES